MHSKIVSTFKTIDKNNKTIIEKHTSTAGRFLLANVLPLNHNIKFSLINKLLTKKNVSEVIDTIFRYCGQKETVIFCDRIKTLGFKHAFKAGISFGKDDLIIPKNTTTYLTIPRGLGNTVYWNYNSTSTTTGAVRTVEI